MVTALEGNLMARNGRAGPALATAAIGSFVAGTIATILLTLFAPIVARLALNFGPTEYFAILVLSFTTSFESFTKKVSLPVVPVCRYCGDGVVALMRMRGDLDTELPHQKAAEGAASWPPA